jgi:hypothetical protein
VKGRNFWIAVGLLLANGLAWLGAPPAWDLIQVEPRIAPQIDALRTKVDSGEAGGESFRVVVSEREMAETVAWFLDRHPEIPFSHPWVEIEPGGVTGRGLAHVLGLRTPVEGRARVELEDGVPVFTVQDLGVAGLMAPGPVLDAVRRELEARLDFGPDSLPVEVTRLELGEGTITLEGVIR